MLCTPYPTFAVRFPTQKIPTDVFVCLGCGDLWFGPRSLGRKGGKFHGGAFRGLALAAFPNDQGIQDLERKAQDETHREEKPPTGR
jgi:hypothetical protein